ncbi:hypothetical protein HYY71_07270 [Candidatus Woesearchaeota archaeon]|nr:hypothetical protein [Candidatus Woesearchaeota archaeon]
MAFLESFFRKSKKGAIEEVIFKNNITVLLIPNRSYHDEVLNIVKASSKRFKKILYVSVNMPAEKVAGAIKEKGIDAEKFLFVDAVNDQTKEDISYHNFIFINSPKNFERFNAQLSHILEKEKFDCLIFDSLSTMLIYNDESTVTKFAHDITKKLAVAHANSILPCLSEDANSVLIKDIAMFVDKVVSIGEEEPPAKKGIAAKKEIAPKLENELNSIKNAYASGLISEQAYLKAKERLESKLKKLRKNI